MKFCMRCERELPLSQFHKRKNRPSGVVSHCKECISARGKERYIANRDKIKLAARRYQIYRNYGITLDQYEEMLETQGWVCAICTAAEPGGRGGAFHVDHCHDSGRVRGLLCYNCNVGMGFFGHDPETLRIAAKYLEETSLPGLTAEGRGSRPLPST